MKKLGLLLIASILLTQIANLSYASGDLDSLLKEIEGIGGGADAVHTAGEVTIENISYTTDGKDLYTVTWTPITASANVKVEIKESKEADYFTLNTVKGSDGKIDIKLPAAGQYQIRLTAIDTTSSAAISKEYIQTIKVDGTTPAPAPTPTPTPTTTTTTTPTVQDAKTGPGTNIVLFSVLMGLMMYGVMRFRKS